MIIQMSSGKKSKVVLLSDIYQRVIQMNARNWWKVICCLRKNTVCRNMWILAG